MKTKNAILFLFVIVIIFLLLGCGHPQKDGSLTPPYQGATVKDITFKGDDLAKNLGQSWGGDVENDGVAGATIAFLLRYPDSRKLKTVVLFAGVDDLGREQQTAEETIPQYIKLYASINAAKLFCVGVPPVYGASPYNSSLWPEIWELNQALKVICGEDRYVDTWKMPFTSSDGIHPNAAMNALIKAKIVELGASQ